MTPKVNSRTIFTPEKRGQSPYAASVDMKDWLRGTVPIFIRITALFILQCFFISQLAQAAPFTTANTNLRAVRDAEAPEQSQMERIVTDKIDRVKNEIKDRFMQARAVVTALGGDSKHVVFDHVNFEPESAEARDELIAYLQKAHGAQIRRMVPHHGRQINVLQLDKPVNLGKVDNKDIYLYTVEISDPKPGSEPEGTRIDHAAFTYAQPDFDLLLENVTKRTDFDAGQTFKRPLSGSRGTLEVAKPPFEVGISSGFKPQFGDVMLELRNDHLLPEAAVTEALDKYKEVLGTHGTATNKYPSTDEVRQALSAEELDWPAVATLLVELRESIKDDTTIRLSKLPGDLRDCIDEALSAAIAPVELVLLGKESDTAAKKAACNALVLLKERMRSYARLRDGLQDTLLRTLEDNDHGVCHAAIPAFSTVLSVMKSLDKEPGEVATRPTPALQVSSMKRVLVIPKADDDSVKTFAAGLQDALRALPYTRKGVEVTVPRFQVETQSTELHTDDGLAAELIISRIAEPEQIGEFDLVVLDTSADSSHTDVQIAAEIKREFPDIPILLRAVVQHPMDVPVFEAALEGGLIAGWVRANDTGQQITHALLLAELREAHGIADARLVLEKGRIRALSEEEPARWAWYGAWEKEENRTWQDNAAIGRIEDEEEYVEEEAKPEKEKLPVLTRVVFRAPGLMRLVPGITGKIARAEQLIRKDREGEAISLLTDFSLRKKENDPRVIASLDRAKEHLQDRILEYVVEHPASAPPEYLRGVFIPAIKEQAGKAVVEFPQELHPGDEFSNRFGMPLLEESGFKFSVETNSIASRIAKNIAERFLDAFQEHQEGKITSINEHLHEDRYYEAIREANRAILDLGSARRAADASEDSFLRMLDDNYFMAFTSLKENAVTETADKIIQAHQRPAAVEQKLFRNLSRAQYEIFEAWDDVRDGKTDFRTFIARGLGKGLLEKAELWTEEEDDYTDGTVTYILARAIAKASQIQGADLPAVESFSLERIATTIKRPGEVPNPAMVPMGVRALFRAHKAGNTQAKNYLQDLSRGHVFMRIMQDLLKNIKRSGSTAPMTDINRFLSSFREGLTPLQIALEQLPENGGDAPEALFPASTPNRRIFTHSNSYDGQTPVDYVNNNINLAHCYLFRGLDLMGSEEDRAIARYMLDFMRNRRPALTTALNLVTVRHAEAGEDDDGISEPAADRSRARGLTPRRGIGPSNGHDRKAHHHRDPGGARRMARSGHAWVPGADDGAEAPTDADSADAVRAELRVKLTALYETPEEQLPVNLRWITDIHPEGMEVIENALVEADPAEYERVLKNTVGSSGFDMSWVEPQGVNALARFLRGAEQLSPDSSLNNVRRVLFVDDHPLMRRIIPMVIVDVFREIQSQGGETEDITVDVAESADQALEMIAGGDYDLVVTDYRMPGKTGIELAGEVKTQHPLLPLLLATTEDLALLEYIPEYQERNLFVGAVNKNRISADLKPVLLLAEFRSQTDLEGRWKEGEEGLRIEVEDRPETYARDPQTGEWGVDGGGLTPPETPEEQLRRQQERLQKEQAGQDYEPVSPKEKARVDERIIPVMEFLRRQVAGEQADAIDAEKIAAHAVTIAKFNVEVARRAFQEAEGDDNKAQAEEALREAEQHLRDIQAMALPDQDEMGGELTRLDPEEETAVRRLLEDTQTYIAEHGLRTLGELVADLEDAGVIERVSGLPAIGNILIGYGNFANLVYMSGIVVGMDMEAYSADEINQFNARLRSAVEPPDAIVMDVGWLSPEMVDFLNERTSIEAPLVLIGGHKTDRDGEKIALRVRQLYGLDGEDSETIKYPFSDDIREAIDKLVDSGRLVFGAGYPTSQGFKQIIQRLKDLKIAYVSAEAKAAMVDDSLRDVHRELRECAYMLMRDLKQGNPALSVSDGNVTITLTGEPVEEDSVSEEIVIEVTRTDNTTDSSPEQRIEYAVRADLIRQLEEPPERDAEASAEGEEEPAEIRMLTSSASPETSVFALSYQVIVGNVIRTKQWKKWTGLPAVTTADDIGEAAKSAVEASTSL